MQSIDVVFHLAYIDDRIIFAANNHHQTTYLGRVNSYKKSQTVAAHPRSKLWGMQGAAT